MASKIIRITMFKLPKASIEGVTGLYNTLSKTAVKDGAPYILSLEAGPAHEDARSQGYSFVAKSEFKTLEDMRFYDEECAAHQVLKVGAKSLGVEGVLTIYYEAAVTMRL